MLDVTTFNSEDVIKKVRHFCSVIGVPMPELTHNMVAARYGDIGCSISDAATDIVSRHAALWYSHNLPESVYVTPEMIAWSGDHLERMLALDQDIPSDIGVAYLEHVIQLVMPFWAILMQVAVEDYRIRDEETVRSGTIAEVCITEVVRHMEPSLSGKEACAVFKNVWYGEELRQTDFVDYHMPIAVVVADKITDRLGHAFKEAMNAKLD